jgi:hypothetical protein
MQIHVEDSLWKPRETKDNRKPTLIAWVRLSTQKQTYELGVAKVEKLISEQFPTSTFQNFYVQETGGKGYHQHYERFRQLIANSEYLIVIVDEWYSLGHVGTTKRQFLDHLVTEKKAS